MQLVKLGPPHRHGFDSACSWLIPAVSSHYLIGIERHLDCVFVCAALLVAGPSPTQPYLTTPTALLTEDSLAVSSNDHFVFVFLMGGPSRSQKHVKQLRRSATVNMSNCFIHEVCRAGAASSVLTGGKRITTPPVPRPLHLSGSVTLQPQVQDLRPNVPTATFAFAQR